MFGGFFAPFFFFYNSMSDLRTYLRQTSSEKETWWGGGEYGLVRSINHIITKVPRKHQLWGLFSPPLWTVGYLKYSLWTDFNAQSGISVVFQCSPSFPPPALPGAPKVFATAWISSQKCSIQPLFLGSDFWAKLKQNKGWAVPTTSPTAGVPLPRGPETFTEGKSARTFLHSFLKSFIQGEKKVTSEDGDEEETLVSLGPGARGCGTLIRSPCLCTKQNGPAEGPTMQSLLPHPFRIHVSLFSACISNCGSIKPEIPLYAWMYRAKHLITGRNCSLGTLLTYQPGLVWHLPNSKDTAWVVLPQVFSTWTSHRF